MKQKIAIVTGANRGIGFAVAKGLLKAGVTVIATSRTPEKGKATVQKLTAHGTAIHHQLDVTDKDSINRLAQYINNEYGHLDILVNNAAINYDTWHNVVNADLQEVRQTLETNIMAQWEMIQTFLPLLRTSAAARIVNVSSGAGAWESQDGTRPGYSLSKLGLNALTRQFAAFLKTDGIVINSVCPGWVRTDMGGANADRSPEEGAETIIWAALLGEDAPTGKFFRDKREIAF